MRSFRDYSGDIPSGVEVVREGVATRINFDFALDERTIDDVVVQMLAYENVDMRCSVDYGSVVNAIVSDRYAPDKVQAIMANYQDAKDSESEITDEKRAEYLQEYSDYQEWRKKAKTVASAVVDAVNS